MESEVGTPSGLTAGFIPVLNSVVGQDGTQQLFAGASSGIYQSGDLGRTWSRAATGDSEMGLVLTLGLSPVYGIDQSIFAGAPNGLWQSPDGGRTWVHLVAGGQVNAVALAPADEQHFRIFVGTEEDGILRSDDGGRTWISSNPGLIDFTVVSLAVAPDFHRSQLLFAGTSTGLYKSTTSGRAWRPVILPTEPIVVECIVMIPTPSSDPLVLVGTEANGLFKSHDGGQSWEVVEELELAGVSAIASARSGADRHFIACSTGLGLAVSEDYGESWHVAERLENPVLSLLVLESDSCVVLVAGTSEHGIVRSVDGGVTWERTRLLAVTN